MTQVRTEVLTRNFKLLRFKSFTGPVPVSDYTGRNPSAPFFSPVYDTISTGSYGVFVGVQGNYLKLRMAINGDSNFWLTIFGYNVADKTNVILTVPTDTSMYIPQVLYHTPAPTNCTRSSSTVSIPDGQGLSTWRECVSFPVNSSNLPPVKTFNAPSNSLAGGGATLIVDTMGCDLLYIYAGTSLSNPVTSDDYQLLAFAAGF
jgi:hypothetical protein